MAVDDVHEDYAANVGRWKLVDDICDENDLSQHIYDLDTDKYSDVNKAFKKRASFMGVTGFTESAMMGIAFEKEPVLKLPSALEYLVEDFDGTGINFANHLLGSLSGVLRKGRMGLFVTYPQRDGDTSRADQEAGNAVATIHAIDASRIINWWPIKRGARSILGGVVFKDKMSERSGFDVDTKDILRTLTIEDGALVDRKWEKNGEKWEVIDGTEVAPVDGRGNRWTEIPFIFCGAMDNTWRVDRAPMYSLAKKNADHLNNSAINEEGIWFSGHIQPVADEMDPEAYDVIVSKEKGKGGFKIGAGQMLIAKGFRYEVAEPNTAARQGMIDKVEEMKAIGARILQPGGVAKTAQQDAGEQRVQHSVLSLAVVNIEDAYNTALRWAAQYMNSPEGMVTLSRSFMVPSINSEMLQRFVELFDRGLVGPVEAHNVLTDANIVDDEKTVDEYVEEVNGRGGMEPPVNADA